MNNPVVFVAEPCRAWEQYKIGTGYCQNMSKRDSQFCKDHQDAVALRQSWMVTDYNELESEAAWTEWLEQAEISDFVMESTSHDQW